MRTRAISDDPFARQMSDRQCASARVWHTPPKQLVLHLSSRGGEVKESALHEWAREALASKTTADRPSALQVSTVSSPGVYGPGGQVQLSSEAAAPEKAALVVSSE